MAPVVSLPSSPSNPDLGDVAAEPVPVQVIDQADIALAAAARDSGPADPEAPVGAPAGSLGSAVCPACEEEVLDSTFCEACGASLDGTAPPVAIAAPAPAPVPVASSGPVCEKCAGTVADGWCTSCGHRHDPVVLDDRGPVAFATHRGRSHHRNEDAAAMSRTAEGHWVLVVCDGVSSSPNPQLASSAAARAAAEVLGGSKFDAEASLHAAVAAAQSAASDVSPLDADRADEPHGAPASTIAIAVVTSTHVWSANIGDCRVFHVDRDAHPTQLSVDHSVAQAAIEAGVDPQTALNSPGGHAITAWLGADADGFAPTITKAALAPGHVVACSDGLWNYSLDGVAIANLVTFGTVNGVDDPADPGTVADRCAKAVAFANESGGVDNITVAACVITEVPPFSD